MKYVKKFYPFLTLAVLLLLTSCAATTFSSVWKDQKYEGQLEKIMVVSSGQYKSDRRLFEDQFVREVKNHGAEAIASYTVLPDSSVTDSKAIEAQAIQMGADAVLTSTFTGAVYEPQEIIPGFEIYEPGKGEMSYVDVYINMQTNIYEVKTHRLLWTASTKTWQREGITDKYRIQSVVKAILKKMTKQGLLKPELSDVSENID